METTPIRPGHSLDLHQLTRYLTANLSGFSAPLDVVQFAFGQSNPTYLLTSGGGRKWVLRKKPAGVLIASAHAVEREYEVMRQLHAAGFPVPHVHLLERSGAVVGTPFYVMEYVAGRIFTDVTMPSLSAAERRRCYQSAVQVLARLHSIDVVAVGLQSLAPTTPYAERQLKRLMSVSAQQATHATPLPDLPFLSDWFTRHMPTSEICLIHGGTVRCLDTDLICLKFTHCRLQNRQSDFSSHRAEDHSCTGLGADDTGPPSGGPGESVRHVQRACGAPHGRGGRVGCRAGGRVGLGAGLGGVGRAHARRVGTRVLCGGAPRIPTARLELFSGLLVFQVRGDLPGHRSPVGQGQRFQRQCGSSGSAGAATS